MTSVESALPIAEELSSGFRLASMAPNPQIRAFFVRVQSGALAQIKTLSSSESVASDFDQIAENIEGETPCFVLFNLGKKEWLFITFMPDDSKVNDRMLYASSKSTLKSKLGAQHFKDDYQASSKSELSYEKYQGGAQPQNALSAKEQDVIAEKKAEAAEATERMKKTNIGGYHVVEANLAANVKEGVDKFKTGGATFVEFKIGEPNETVEVVEAKAVLASALQSAVNQTEPRFYLFSFRNKTLYIYVCPPNAQHKLRMVYSTCKPSLASKIESFGVKIDKKLELSEPEELTESYLQSELSSTASTAVAGKVKAWGTPSATAAAKKGAATATAVPVITTPHPIYGGASSPRAGAGAGVHPPVSPKKKIVMPPPGAYQ